MQKSKIHYWLALKLVPRLAIHKKLALVESYGLTALFSSSAKKNPSFTSANSLTAKQLASFYQPDWHKIDDIIRNSKNCHSEIIVFDDPVYPQLLKQIYDPPLVLFVQGNAKLLNETQLAIVGSRSASINGRETAFEIARQLVESGIVITSGLALGIDAAAHKGALTNCASTIAVVATGLDNIYPSRHRDLAANILEKDGAIISEFLPGTLPKPGHFPKRNRIISGLSVGVLVVEAALQSGSLITARCALEQNRDIFSIPSGINNPQAKGCHWLIKQGAKLVEESADIIDELAFINNFDLQLKPQHKRQLNINEEIDGKSLNKDLFVDELLASVGFEITPVDKVVSRSKLPVEEVLTRLTILELNGLVAAVPGGYLRLHK
ncbi:DNA-processing protein DprA [Colwellia sp. 4_MG-2023]|uniref:DNA-processing protein DprA n=1 Tax=unclassified Colwellia TaxID=196834 RepID=UPI0026E425AC|nr:MULTISPECIES: DNA-processing protein DprA [unclassified Colwellia]MDO6505976.1 DNA-processing protein DprA [Colwellia sp. 5_MG-2023]MDO6554657.1 DNA-processing protein DprA [Colwellia sp. 4_MG-2023]